MLEPRREKARRGWEVWRDRKVTQQITRQMKPRKSQGHRLGGQWGRQRNQLY